MILCPDLGLPTLEPPLLRSFDTTLPLRDVKLDVNVSGLFADVTLTQVFENDTTSSLEVTYTFPLPGSYAVTKMQATLGGRKVKAVLKERAKARKMYQDALQAGQRAALAEEDRPEVFNITLGNIAPGEQAQIQIKLAGRLEVSHSEAMLRLPTVVGQRYTTGEPLGDSVSTGTAADTDAIPDASRVTPPRLDPLERRPGFSFNMSFKADGLKVSQASSPLHSLDFKGDDHAWTASFSAPERLDRDIVVRIPLKLKKDSMTLTLTPDKDTKGGTWTLEVLAPKAARTPRQVCVVLDRSGSMTGWKMRTAIQAAQAMVSSLNEDDAFNVVVFDHETLTWESESLVPASEGNRTRAIRWLENVDARGGTEMSPALLRSFDLLKHAQNGNVFFVTDGQVSGEDSILRALAAHPASPRVFALGVDRAVNMGFLKRLASQTGAIADMVESEQRLLEISKRLTKVVSVPSFEEVKLSDTPFQIVDSETTPTLFTDAYPGVPLVISGRFKGAAPSGPARVSFTRKGKAETVKIDPVTAPSVARKALWARAKIRDLEDAYASHPDAKLEKRIVRTSLSFKVLSRFTAFIAVDKERQEITSSLAVHQKVEDVSGWGMTRSAARVGSFAASSFTGAVAPAPVNMSSAAPVANWSTSTGTWPQASSPADYLYSPPGDSWTAPLDAFQASPKLERKELVVLLKRTRQALQGDLSLIGMLVLALSPYQLLEPRLGALMLHLTAAQAGSAQDISDALELIEEILK